MRTAGGFIAAAMVMAAIFTLLPGTSPLAGNILYTAATAFTANPSAVPRLRRAYPPDQFRRAGYSSTVPGGPPVPLPVPCVAAPTGACHHIVGFVLVGRGSPDQGERVINLRQSLASTPPDRDRPDYQLRSMTSAKHCPWTNCSSAGSMAWMCMTWSRFFEREAGKYWWISPPRLHEFYRGLQAQSASMLAKRWSDIAASFLLLMFSWPFMLLTPWRSGGRMALAHRCFPPGTGWRTAGSSRC